jgi:hypothetical protein
MTGMRGHGIAIDAAAGAGTIADIIIEGNIVRGTSAQDSDSSGILVGGWGTPYVARSANYSAADVAVSDIAVRNNRVTLCANRGIYMNGANIARADISGNSVTQNGQETAGPGIELVGLTSYRCFNNRSGNVSGSGQTYGISLTGGAGTNMIYQNNLVGNATAALLRTSLAGTNYIWHNPPDAGTQSSTALSGV